MHNKGVAHYIKLQFIFITLFVISFFNYNIFSQGFTILNRTTPPISASVNTGEKPQSKVWYYNNYWFTVIPISGGTYLYRLDGLSWTKLIKLSDQYNVQADVKSLGNKTYILLVEAGTPRIPDMSLVEITYVNGTTPPEYTLASEVTIPLTPDEYYIETATLDIDSNGRMWIAHLANGGGSSTQNKSLFVRFSSYTYPPYTSWEEPLIFASGTYSTNYDDICAITAFGGNKIGVFWSDQNDEKFYFKVHFDSKPTSINAWETTEPAANGSHIADDHINLAVDSRDGTIYAAVKTTIDDGGANPNTRIGLLVRRPNGSWDNMYKVAENIGGSGSTAIGTRPIVLLNESEDVVDIFFTEKNNSSNLIYKESPISNISFDPNKYEYLTFGSNYYNNLTSTKQSYNGELVLMFSVDGGTPWSGLRAERTSIPTNNGAGYAFNFTGSSPGIKIQSNIDVAHPSSTLNFGTNPFTIEAWFNSSSTNTQTIFSRLSGSSGYALGLTGGRIQFTINSTTVFSSSTYPINLWTHVAVTFNDSHYYMYINGVLDSDANIGAPTQGDRNAIIGAGSDYSSVFRGALDEVRIWNVARTQDQIRTYMSQKIDEENLPSSLVGYWRFDTPQGLNVQDLTSNNNYGTIYNIASFNYIWSGAPIGDQSAYDYSGTSPVNLASGDGDDVTVTTTAGTGIQLYRVDAPSMRGPIGDGLIYPNSPLDGSSPAFTYMDPLRYWGVKVIGSGSYSLVYNYWGHLGLGNESDLRLAVRNGLKDPTWSNSGIIPNTGQHTLSASGISGVWEYTLASSSSPLPVELTSFTARIINKNVMLNWRTETEVNNYGFDLERSNDGVNFNKIKFIDGNGNSNSPKDYSYVDDVDKLTGKLFYRLKQIDSDGKYSYSNIVSLILDLPVDYMLSQNYPNPFNPSTKITYELPVKSKVVIKVFDMLGNQVAILEDDEKDAGYYDITFNAKDLASGVYFYTISAGEFNMSKKMLLLK